MQAQQQPQAQPLQQHPGQVQAQPQMMQNQPGNPVVQHQQYAPQPQYQQQQQPQQIQPQPPQQQQMQYQSQQAPVAPQHHGQAVQPQGQQQQHYPHQGLNGGWQSDNDYNERRKMIAKIVHLLQQRKPNAPQEWLKKLPQMAKRLEESLYRSAKSFAEYNDTNTLKQRLQQLAVNIGMKTKKMQQAQMAQQKMQQQQQQQQVPQAQYRPQQQQVQQVQPRPQGRPLQQPPPQPSMQQPPQGGQRIVNMADINPIMGQQQHAPQPVPAPAPVQPAPVQYQQQMPVQQQQAPAPPQANGAPQGGQRPVSDRQQVLRHQQQRLLLLRHAAKCQHEDGRCPVTPHCAGMKRLWKHIAECKDQKCLVPHCVSSRYVLSHYHRCKDVRCPVCGPVREAIHRSHEKQKQMQALKQRHQQAVQQTQGHPQPLPSQAPQQPLPQPLQPNAPPVAVPLQPNKRQKVAPSTQVTPYQQLPVPSNSMRQQPMQPASAMPAAPPHAGIGAAPGQQPGVGGKPQVASVPGIAFSNGQVIMPKHTGPKPQEDHTLINCFSIEQIETHIASLNKGLQLQPQKLKTKCLDVLKVLQSHQHGWVFNSPVDPVELGLPDYFEVIKQPMDLGTIRKKLENGCYHSLEEFRNNVDLTFDNAMLYNPEGSVVYNMAKEMKEKFAHDYELLLQELEREEDIKRKNGEACLLCGCEKLLFEPPVFYCNGLNCPSKRIRRNSYYFVTANNQYHWCHLCFAELKDGRQIALGDMTVKKEELAKKKNDEVHEESWVQCDRCERWIHQICALFNTRQNKDQRSEYACPRCTIADRKKTGKTEATSTTPMAEDLQRTLLSEHLENHVKEKSQLKLKQMAEEKAQREGITIEEANKAFEMGPITIRQVTSMDRKLEVRERMKKRYAFKNYPEEFTFRCKCIVVFQNIDGVDVILFGLYVYEHDEKNPSPNTRTVYVSYLDSVHFMTPRQMRTFVYHEILIAYLDYVRRRGFSTAHIWACPPLKGDDYILYAKPEDQKTPKDDRLRQWYIDMLVECQRRGIVGKLTNMYDLYFKNPAFDATVVPYMDGDYFPAEVENIIKDIEEGKGGKKSGGQGSKKKKDTKKQKKKTGRGGTRSSGLDEEALKASGIVQMGKDQKSLEEGGRDYVMVKLGETIQPMKESFIVAFLDWEGAKPENLEVPKEIAEYREKHGITSIWKKEGDDTKESSADPQESTAPAQVAETPSTPNEDAAEPMKVDSEAKPPTDEQVPNADGPTPDKDQEQDDGDAKPMDIDTETEKPPDALAANAGSASKPDEKTVGADGAQASTEESGKDSGESSIPSNGDKPSPSPGEGDKPESLSNGDKTGVTQAKKAVPGQPDSGEEPKPPEDPPGEQPQKEVEKITESADETKTSSDPSSPVADDKPDGDKATSEGDAPPADKMAVDNVQPSAEPPAGDEDAQGQTKEEETSGPAPADTISSTTENAPPNAAPQQDVQQIASRTTMEERKGKFAAMAKKRGREEVNEPEKEPDKPSEDKKEPPKVSKSITVKDSKGRMVKVIDDDDEEMDCEFLNNRQAFLNLCQGNHYQFDQLRRAKHSSMMVLWHLHNRDAPKFVQQCATCSREILSGYRFHCPICADFDQCQECVSNPNVPRHPHQLKPTPVSGQQTELTEAQRKERQRSIKLHMTLLQHAATCSAPNCPSANCTKMKGLLKHGAQCKVKATGGCNFCKRIWALLQIHARQCKLSNCKVPNCLAIRERVRQLKKQQQAMDDRRRLEMNRAYRGAR